MSDQVMGEPAAPEGVGADVVEETEVVVEVEDVTPPVEGVVTAAGVARRVGKTRNPWGAWALSLITFGIYGLWWYYTINRELRDYDSGIKVDPMVSLLALLLSPFTLGITAVVSIFKCGDRIKAGQETAEAEERCSALLGIVLALFVFGTWIVYYQSQINKLWDQYDNPPEGTTV